MTRRECMALAMSALSAAGFARAQDTGAPDSLTGEPQAALLTRLRGGALSPVEVIDAYLEAIERHDRRLGAYITRTGDRARARARQLSAVPPRDRGALFGLPVAHKDLFETAGVRTTGGSRLFADHVPDRDATLVARLSAAGAIMLGKTNTHELGGGVTTINPFFGTTRNPRDVGRIAGGSSGGSAAAVAARLAVAATGSDTGGSIRIPAALCGCVGFKPTHGVLSTAGVLGASPTFDHTGFLTRRVADLEPLLQATMGIDPADPSTVPALPLLRPGPMPLSGLRFGVPRAYFFDALDTDVAGAVERALTRLTAAGAVVREVRTPVDDTTMARVFDPIAVAEIHQTYAKAFGERPELFSDEFTAFFKAPVPSGLELAGAHRERRRFQAALSRVFGETDVLVLPTVPIVAPPIEGPIDGALILRNTWPFNAAHAPALTLPCGPADRLPAGLQLAARPFDDARLLRIAAAVERALD